MKIKAPLAKKLILVCLLCMAFMVQPMAAAEDTGMILVEVISGTLVVVEGVNLLVHAILDAKDKGRKGPVPKTKVPPVTNLIALTNTAKPLTNNIHPITNLLSLAITNIPQHHPATNMTTASNTNMSPITFATQRSDTNLLSLRPAILSNLTESEKQDIMLFGKDYYYLVALAYYKVKKYDKAKEFMLHSLAIEVRVKEAVDFLRDAFQMTDEDIRRGVMRYMRSHE